MIAPPWLPIPPPAYGGTERVIDGLCRGLVAGGHDVLLYATGDSTCPIERAWTYDTGRGTTDTAPAVEQRHVIDAYRTAAQWGADVIHDHTLTGPARPRRGAGAPVVTTNHLPFEGALAALYRRVSSNVPVIAISHHQASTALGVRLAAVIHHGIDPAQYPMGCGGGGYALFLGRMSPEKGVDMAIRVARAAGMPLRIAAKMQEPSERDYFEARVRPLLHGDVEFIGEVGGEQKVSLLTDAECLLNPIAWPEPFGMVMIEALACGTPVVTTRRGSSPEIVDDDRTGFLRSDEASLAAAIAEVRSIDRQACRDAVLERFSISRMAANHTATYAKAVDDESRTGAIWDKTMRVPLEARSA